MTSGQVASNTAQIALLRLLAHRLRDAVRAEDHGLAVGHLGEVVDEHGAALAQALDDEAVVHDLVAHVDRRAEDSSTFSTISMARSTPAQKPRGLARRIFMVLGSLVWRSQSQNLHDSLLFEHLIDEAMLEVYPA